MTTLYRPVKITSAEQAEALPIGTVAVSPANDLGAAQACIRVEGGWHVTREIENNDQDTLEHALMIGDQALVPIESEEEWALVQDDEGSMDIYADEAEAREWARLDGGGSTPVTRYVTAWTPKEQA